jgi:hypothetical protein
MWLKTTDRAPATARPLPGRFPGRLPEVLPGHPLDEPDEPPGAAVTPPPGRSQARSHPAWRRAWTVGPLLAVVVYGAGTLLGLAHLPPLAVIIGCVVVGALLVLAALLTSQTGPSAGYGCACGVAIGAWLAYAGTAAAWSWPPAVVLAVVAAVLIRQYPLLRVREDEAAEQARLAAEAAAIARKRDKWPDLIGRIGHKGVKFAGQEQTLAGYLVHLRLPGSGRVTYSALAPATEQLEVAARLRHGSLRFERGAQAHEVILHVAERDVLAETIPLPEQEGSLSITRPIPVGLYEDGQVCAVTLREIASLIVGLRGSGKSNLLNVLLAQLARCPDVLIFAIDLKGGRMAAPWIEPWLAGRSPRPVVDWLATDREEAERMLRALLRAVQARSRSGSGGEKITPSPRQPAILLVCDEIAVILGIGTGGPRTSLDGVTNATLAGLATQLVMTGRSEAIDLIMATQRGTVTMTGSADLKSQCGLRIGLGVASEADARLIIPDDIRIAADLARLRHPGTGIVQQGKQGRVLPVKFFRIEHEAISEIAERYGRIRPGPDKLLEDALGEDYATRWSPGRAARIPGVASRPLVPASIAGPAEAPPHAIAQAAPRAIPGTGRPPLLPHAAPPAIEADVVYGARGVGGEPGHRGGPADAGHPARLRMMTLLKSAGVRGMTVRSISEQLTADGRDVAQQTIHRWLGEEAAAGHAENASYGRWKWRADQ